MNRQRSRLTSTRHLEVLSIRPAGQSNTAALNWRTRGSGRPLGRTYSLAALEVTEFKGMKSSQGFDFQREFVCTLDIHTDTSCTLNDPHFRQDGETDGEEVAAAHWNQPSDDEATMRQVLSATHWTLRSWSTASREMGQEVRMSP